MRRARSTPGRMRLPLARSFAEPSDGRGALRRLAAPNGRLEEIEDSRILVGPRVRAHEAVIFDGVGHEPPALLSELDQPLREADAVLEVHVRVDHAVQNEERIIETLGEENGR